MLADHTSTSVNSWPTPQTRGFVNHGDIKKLSENCKDFAELSAMAYRAADKKKRGYWPTPNARDWKDTPGMALTSVNSDGSTRNRADQLARVVYQEDGENHKNGTLNPDWVEWLMGWPAGWTDLTAKPDIDSIRDPNLWKTDPADSGEIPRVKKDIPARAKRLKAIGNGWVPQVGARAFRMLSRQAQ